MWVRGKVNNQVLWWIAALLHRVSYFGMLAQVLVLKTQSGGRTVVDVNGKPRPILFEIVASFATGNLQLPVDVRFFVMDHLPHCCILGINFLNKLNDSGIDNKNRNLLFNNSTGPIFSTPQCRGVCRHCYRCYVTTPKFV